MDGKGLLVILLAALVAILTKSSWERAAASAPPSQASTDGATPKAGAPPPPGTADKRGDDTDPVWQIQRDFPGAFALPEGRDPRRKPLDSPVRLVLATLPNPASSGFAAEFDRGIEAIERSVQSQRYVIQRYWFPWAAGSAADARGKPGWLLFRRDAGASVELLLFELVSESPASGVDPTELDNALDALETLAGSNIRRPAQPSILLLGPYFSGAAASLEQRLRFWCGGAPGRCGTKQLFAISGSATRRRTQEILHSLGDVFASSEFHATVLPDDVLVAGMHRFLQERLNVPEADVADLTESSTDYGNAVANAAGLKIPFPLQIGVLASDAKAGEGSGVSPDQPMVFDKLAGKKIELQLDNTFAALSRYGIRHVGILATSTRDKVFLAGQFRASAPNLRIHTYESSVDLADRKQRQALEGMMVASSYPLFPATQLWNRQANGALQQFPSMSAEGIYNAVLVLLSRFDVTLERALPDRLLDYVSPFCNEPVAGPSAWISVSISGQLWPLAVYPANVPSDAGSALCPSAKSDPYVFVASAAGNGAGPRGGVQPSFLIVLGLLAVLLLLIGNTAGLVTTLKPYSFWRRALVTYEPEPQAAGRGWDMLRAGPRRRVVLLGLWTLAIMALVMGKILNLPAHFPGDGSRGWAHALAVVLIGGAFVPAGIAFAATVRLGPSEGKWMWVSVAQGVVLGVLALAALTWPFDSMIGKPDGHVYFFFVRAMDPGIGLTPTIPLFTVGVTVYAACLMRLMVIRRAEKLRLESVEWVHTDADPDPAPQCPPSPQSFESCAAAMRDFAREASKSLLPVCAVGVAIGSIVLFLTPLRLGSFEGRPFDLGCSVCFSLVFTLTLAAAWRAQLLWDRLRDFTRALAVHPAAASLARLPDSVAQRFRSPVPGQVGNRQIEVGLKLKMHALGATVAPKIADLLHALDVRWFPLGSAAKAAQQAAAAGGGVLAPAAPAPALPTRDELQEDFLALHMARVLGLMCDATRTMLFIATGAGIAALFGYALYPFQPAAALTGAGLVSVGLVALVALRVLLGIERDHVLSLVAQTAPGKITPTLGLAARLIGYVIVPLGTLIGSRLQDQGTVIEVFQNLAKTLNR